MSSMRAHWVGGSECPGRASKHGDKVPERRAVRVAAIIKGDPADPWDEDEPTVAIGDVAL